MPAIKKILCPTDFSEASFEGLSYAVELATPGETELCVVHVDPATGEAASFEFSLMGTADAAVRRAHAVTALSEVLEDWVPPAINSRPLLRSGNIAREIVRAAGEEAVDLIVLTTHGAAGWRPGGLGAVAEEVVRTAPCPVLTISAPASGNIDGPTPAAESESNGTHPHVKNTGQLRRNLCLDDD
jgi:nucleotide-binding universal stress UspA family protein